MEQLTRNQFGALVPNDQVIIAGYGKQGNGDDYHEKRRLKFASFRTFGYQDHLEIHYTSKYAQHCDGRS